MTFEELLVEAAKGRRWHVSAGGAVRCESGLCPIVAVAAGRGWEGRGRPPHNGDYPDAAKWLGMREGGQGSNSFHLVAAAADGGSSYGPHKEARRRMLEVLVGEGKP